MRRQHRCRHWQGWPRRCWADCSTGPLAFGRRCGPRRCASHSPPGLSAFCSCPRCRVLPMGGTVWPGRFGSFGSNSPGPEVFWVWGRWPIFWWSVWRRWDFRTWCARCWACPPRCTARPRGWWARRHWREAWLRPRWPAVPVPDGCILFWWPWERCLCRPVRCPFCPVRAPGVRRWWCCSAWGRRWPVCFRCLPSVRWARARPRP